MQRHGFRLETYEELPSTNDALLQRTDETNLAILALRQTKGRGSHGRAWTAPEGNLNLSVLLHPDHPTPWALLVAVAVHHAIAAWLPDAARLTLKWPNDLLLDGTKLGGILLESGPDWLVIGIGLNLREAPDLPDRPTAALADLIDPPTPEAVAQSVLASLSHWLAIEAAEGFPPIRAAWLQAAHPEGTPLRVTQFDTVIEGRFAGLADSGALLLQSRDGLRTLYAGTVI